MEWGALAFVSKSHSSTEQSCSSGRSMSHWPSTSPSGVPFVSRTIAQRALLIKFLSTFAAFAAWNTLVSKAVALASLSPNFTVISVRGSAA
jgi:hypothetical protein